MSSIYLPLYATKTNTCEPAEKSGLNQWNAHGRPRDYDEVYIPIPFWIHERFPNFFPGRDTPFNLILPNGKTLNCKVCQDNGKALMSNPNSELGYWILREELEIPSKELATRGHFISKGTDCVEISKISNSTYKISCAQLGMFEEFKKNNRY